MISMSDRRRRYKTFAFFISTFALSLLTFALPSGINAHPMGNFSINHYSGLEVGPEDIRVRYILDFAEIPTFQEMQVLDRDRNGTISGSEREVYLAERTRHFAAGLRLEVAEQALALVPLSYDLAITPGAGGLPTIKISVLYRAAFSKVMKAGEKTEPSEIFYQDRNFPGRAGWKEIAAAGRDGMTVIGSDLPSVGGELRSYPEEAIKSPPQIVEARLDVAAGAGQGRGSGLVERPPGAQPALAWTDRLTSLISCSTPTTPVILLSLLIAFALGTIHALSPGHGKAVVAGYLVGSRGTARHALILGVIVTISHTVGVFLLGLATLFFSQFFVPERLYPWLGFFSGLTIFIIGIMLLRQRWHASNMLQTASHHLHHDHNHLTVHSHPHHHDGEDSFRRLVGLGITGGIIPCPSALVVLLSAIAFHQVAFGLLLIVAFSAGIATTLVGIGLLMVYLEEALSRVDRFNPLARLLPVTSAAAVALLGGVIAIGTWF